MDKFIKEYEGRAIEDDGSYNSPEMKSFSRKFKNYLKRTCRDCEIRNYHLGHYEVSGFLEKSGRFAYFNFSVPRGNRPIDTGQGDWENPDSRVLIRKATGDTDYMGGQNHFCSLANIAKTADWLLGAV